MGKRFEILMLIFCFNRLFSDKVFHFVFNQLQYKNKKFYRHNIKGSIFIYIFIPCIVYIAIFAVNLSHYFLKSNKTNIFNG